MSESHMKITARLSESGCLVEAANDEDWAQVHCKPASKRPALYCPDSTNTCRNKLVAYERKNPRHGTVTRYFSFAKRSGTCTHAAVKSGVIVPAQPISPSAPSGESDEHMWLKQRVVDIATSAKYSATAEKTLPGDVRADVYVEGVQHGARIEVQRVATDIPTRTEQYPDVIWLLRDAYSTSSGNKEALFSYPCVQIRVTAPRPVGGKREWVPAQPWLSGDWDDARVSASSTVLRFQHDDSGAPVFDTYPMRLDLFLRQVWSGERQWYRKGLAHKTFGGWALVSDVEAVNAWRQERREQARALAAAPRPPTPATVPEPAVLAPPPVPRTGPPAPARRPVPAAAPIPVQMPEARPALLPQRQPPLRNRWIRYLRTFLGI